MPSGAVAAVLFALAPSRCAGAYCEAMYGGLFRGGPLPIVNATDPALKHDVGCETLRRATHA